MPSGIFVFKDPTTLVAMQQSHFAAEEDFQTLLEKFPALISGERLDDGPAKRWLLVEREKTIPSEENGAGRWAIDLLFIDQDSIPTFVEVKRQSDSRLRREVVGQMLDYAANAVSYWPTEELRKVFETRCSRMQIDPDEELRRELKIDVGSEEFWQRVRNNLASGRVRLFFVAYHIPPELRRIVEFLNQQMSPAEVLALELKKYAGEGLTTLVPTLFGQTEEAKQRKGVRATPIDWDEETVFGSILERHGSGVQDIAKRLAAKFREAGAEIWYGRGAKEGSLRAAFNVGGMRISPLTIWTYGKLEIAMPPLAKQKSIATFGLNPGTIFLV